MPVPYSKILIDEAFISVETPSAQRLIKSNHQVGVCVYFKNKECHLHNVGSRIGCISENALYKNQKTLSLQSKNLDTSDAVNCSNLFFNHTNLPLFRAITSQVAQNMVCYVSERSLSEQNTVKTTDYMQRVFGTGLTEI